MFSIYFIVKVYTLTKKRLSKRTNTVMLYFVALPKNHNVKNCGIVSPPNATRNRSSNMFCLWAP